MIQSKYFQVSGNIVDVISGDIFPGILSIHDGIITKIEKDKQRNDFYIMPGLIDSHIHIESSMLVPSEFARAAVIHGTVAAVSDPHEIANVLGLQGVKFMIENGKKVPFKFFFGAPSCVPATNFETSGASLGIKEVEELLSSKDVLYLSEMMNFPGVLSDDPLVIEKISAAITRNKTIDGHAPGLRGIQAKQYFYKGITTDHECFTLDEAEEKADMGMHILIREGSAAKNFDTLLHILKSHPEKAMFCSDDKHPEDLLQNHINILVSRAIKNGYNLIDTLRAATLNPCKHYSLPVGLLQQGDNADFIIVDSPANMKVLETYINGIKVAENNKSLIPRVEAKHINKLKARKLKPLAIEVKAESDYLKAIEIIDGEIITKKKIVKALNYERKAISDLDNDILKLVLLNRYKKSKPSIGFIHNFGLKSGAVASTVSHDSHNIIAAGADDKSICKAINHLINIGGGITFAENDNFTELPLPVAGLMSTEPIDTVAAKYAFLEEKIKNAGCKLNAPLMSLSFLALLVIPELKISDKGLFDGNKFEFVPLFEKQE